MTSIEAYLQTIDELKYEISLKDQALRKADNLIDFLRQENEDLKVQLDNRSVSAFNQTSIDNKQNMMILANIDQSAVMKATSVVSSQREKMKSRFKKYLNTNTSNFASKYQSCRYSYNSVKVPERTRSKSIMPETNQLKTIQDDVAQLKQRIQKKDTQINQIVHRNKQMEEKYSKLLTMLRNKNA